MKNFEAYETDIKTIGLETLAVSKKTGLLNDCDILGCGECTFLDKKCCNKNRVNWLYEEYKKPKAKISLATKVILENLAEKWKWIVRDKNNDVICFENKPIKGEVIRINSVTNGKIHNLTYIFKNDTFDFLSWEDEEPTNIKELLENCEVVE